MASSVASLSPTARSGTVVKHPARQLPVRLGGVPLQARHGVAGRGAQPTLPRTQFAPNVTERRVSRYSCVVTRAAAGALSVSIDKGNGFNSRQLFAGIEINAPAEVVWNALTSYATLQEFIPGLKENTVVEERPRGVLLRQVGQEDLALGVKFTASVLLDIQEYPRGMPTSKTVANGSGKIALPVPKSWDSVPSSCHKDITFELVKGDFQVFNGVWRISPGAAGPSSSRLSYSVMVQPSPWLPVRLVEGRVSGEIGNNLKAVRAFAERKHKAAQSKVPAEMTIE